MWMWVHTMIVWMVVIRVDTTTRWYTPPFLIVTEVILSHLNESSRKGARTNRNVGGNTDNKVFQQGHGLVCVARQVGTAHGSSHPP